MIESFIPLSQPRTDSRLIKTCALCVFRAVRAGVRETRRTPGRLQRISADIREAWRESAQDQ